MGIGHTATPHTPAAAALLAGHLLLPALSGASPKGARGMMTPAIVVSEQQLQPPLSPHANERVLEAVLLTLPAGVHRNLTGT
jgi:hypothetical protein